MNSKSASSGASVLVFSFAALLAGCRVGPNYIKPVVPAPPAFSEQHADSGAPYPSPKDWWTIFSDAALDDLEARTIKANLDIRVAVAQVDQADALRHAVRSAEFPTVAAQPSYGRTRESQDRPNNGIPGARRPPTMTCSLLLR